MEGKGLRAYRCRRSHRRLPYLPCRPYLPYPAYHRPYRPYRPLRLSHLGRRLVRPRQPTGSPLARHSLRALRCNNFFLNFIMYLIEIRLQVVHPLALLQQTWPILLFKLLLPQQEAHIGARGMRFGVLDIDLAVKF